ncbi:MAG: hypothetical protein FWE61_06510 [Micrococcales bacterium]|nr:hypothetical protein [Micrococcales bacterium]
MSEESLDRQAADALGLAEAVFPAALTDPVWNLCANTKVEPDVSSGLA